MIGDVSSLTLFFGCLLGVATQGGSPLSNQENNCSKSEDAATAEMPDYGRWVFLPVDSVAVQSLLYICLCIQRRVHNYTLVIQTQLHACMYAHIHRRSMHECTSTHAWMSAHTLAGHLSI